MPLPFFAEFMQLVCVVKCTDALEVRRFSVRGGTVIANAPDVFDVELDQGIAENELAVFTGIDATTVGVPAQVACIQVQRQSETLLSVCIQAVGNPEFFGCWVAICRILNPQVGAASSGGDDVEGGV